MHHHFEEKQQQLKNKRIFKTINTLKSFLDPLKAEEKVQQNPSSTSNTFSHGEVNIFFPHRVN
jgi:hypothetical protein